MALDSCRVCLIQQTGKMSSIFQDSMVEYIFEISNVLISPDDDMPSKICEECSKFVLIAIDIRRKCILADKQLRTLSSTRATLLEIKNEPEDDSIEVSHSQREVKVLSEYLVSVAKQKSSIVTKMKKCVERKPPKKLPKKSEDPYTAQCLYCGKFMKTRDSLKSHEKRHFLTPKPAGPQVLECDFCGRRFSKKPYLITHLMSVHAKFKRFNCKVFNCQKGFWKKDFYLEHMMMHNNERKIQCPTCNKKFIKNTNFKEHWRIHTGERPYICDQCPKTYAHATDLKRHKMSSHTGERPNKCAYCSKGFIKRSDCTIHERSHTGEKGLNCLVCFKTFNTKSTFNFHTERCNKILDYPIVSKT